MKYSAARVALTLLAIAGCAQAQTPAPAGFDGARAHEHVKALVDLPVVVENDANAAAWGEFRFGAGEDTDDLLLITLGTGIGGGIVHRGQLFRGGFGVAAEIGHMRVVPDGILCGCGQHGCYEQYGSGSALVRAARERVANDDPGAAAIARLADGDPQRITGPALTELAREGGEMPARLSAAGHRGLLLAIRDSVGPTALLDIEFPRDENA